MNTLIIKWSKSRNNCGTYNLTGWLYHESGDLMSKNKATGCGYDKKAWLEMWAGKFGEFKTIEM